MRLPQAVLLCRICDCTEPNSTPTAITLNPSLTRHWPYAAAIAAFILIVYLLGPVLVPFATAAVLAYALHPAVEKLASLKALRLPRVVCVALVIVLFVVAAVSVMLLIVPVIVREIPLLREQIPQLLDRLNAWLTPLLQQLGINIKLDFASLRQMVKDALSDNAQDIGTALLSSVKVGGSLFFTVLGDAILIPVALFYLLMDWPRVVAQSQSLLPAGVKDKVLSFLDEADGVLAQYLRGQLLVMVIMALYYAIALMIAGYDLAWPIGLFTGLAMFIPYVGFGIGLLLAVVAGLLQFDALYALGVVAFVYGVGQVVESLVLTPRLVGERIGLHPLAVIFALLAFGQLFGFVGVLVALPASAVVAVALKRALAAYRQTRLFTGAN
jgi:predicted PurR-regulated permease PerM